MIIRPIKTRLFQEGENLFAFLSLYIPKLPEKSIIVITSKIVALSEKRTAFIRDASTKENLIRSESDWAIQTKHTWLTLKDGNIMASAGIDASNANGKLILLPKKQFQRSSKNPEIMPDEI